MYNTESECQRCLNEIEDEMRRLYVSLTAPNDVSRSAVVYDRIDHLESVFKSVRAHKRKIVARKREIYIEEAAKDIVNRCGMASATIQKIAKEITTFYPKGQQDDLLDAAKIYRQLCRRG